MTSAPIASRRARLLAGALCALLAGLALAAPASGKIVNLYVYNGTYPNGSFDGSDATGASGFSSENPSNIDINQVTGDVFVGASGLIYKFNAAGVSQAFSAVAPNTVVTQGSYGLGAVKVDNSGTGTQGRIYGKEEFSSVGGFLPTGAPIGGPGFPIPSEGLGDACGMEVAPDGAIWIANYGAGNLNRYNTSGVYTGENIVTPTPCGFAMDSEENFYTPGYAGSTIKKYNRAGELIDPQFGGENQGGENIAVDRSTDHVFVALGDHVSEFDPSGSLIGTFGGPEGGKGYPGLSGAEGIAINQTTHKAYVGNGNGGGKVDTFVQTGPITIPNTTTDTPGVTATTASLKGEVDPDAGNGGTAITNCHFEWGESTNYGNSAPCDQSTPINAPEEVTASISGLTTGTRYHYRVTAANSNGVQSNGNDVTFEPAGPPQITEESVSNVNTDGVTITGHISPGGAIAKYHVDYGLTEAYGSQVPVPDAESESNLDPFDFSIPISGLQPGTTYHYRVTADNGNEAGPQHTVDHTFTTFPLNPSGPDPCANAQVRQQTGASLLLDCRAYELVSAPNTGGYDVQSDLIPGQVTLQPQPGAPDRVLYSVHFGTIPDTGEPTNLGPDPYVAARGAGGWTTTYVGIDAGFPPANPKPFGSPVAGSSTALSTFAFGGSTICDPCFSDGSSGIPVRLPDGTLVQGMRGSQNPPGAEPSGYIAKPLSADGSHLVFGSTSRFEPDGLSGGPNISIYDRNLLTETTHVVSKTPGGETMDEAGIGELDISSDGSRILLGKQISTDSAGNTYWHLYMNVGDAQHTVDVTPGTTTGVLYDGMTADGSKVFFTSADKLAGGDTDSSPDMFEADVSAGGATLSKLSPTNGDGCNPVAGKEGPHWNSVSGAANCGVVGIAGGAGVASGDGTVFFLSPEVLDGAATADQPNLYAVRPGQGPKFVATMEATGALVRDAVYDNEVHRFTDFQVTGNGEDAVFSSSLPLTGFPSDGHFEVFRYRSPSSLDCVSCPTTGAAPIGDASLANGLNVTEDGTVFFTSTEALVLRDTNGKKDVYEWENGNLQLVSTGISDFEAGLLSASADGVNVYFYTRATLVPQDENGNLIKIYDARRGGGFLDFGPTPLCAASDECHGPGTQSAPPPQIGSFKGERGNVHPKKKCKKGKVRKHGKCVPKKHKKKKKSHGKNGRAR